MRERESKIFFFGERMLFNERVLQKEILWPPMEFYHHHYNNQKNYCEHTSIHSYMCFRWIANEEKLCLSIQLYTGDVAQYCVNFLNVTVSRKFGTAF